MKRNHLGNLGRLLILGLTIALAIMGGTNSAQVGSGTFDKKTKAAGTLVVFWPD